MKKNQLVLMLIFACFGAAPVVMGEARKGGPLAESLQILHKAGFIGIHKIQIPNLSPAELPVPEVRQNDQEKEMLEAYAKEVLTYEINKLGVDGPTARQLGFKPILKIFEWNDDGTMPIKSHNLKKPTTGEGWSFAVTDARGRIEIILIYLDKDNVMTSYLTSPSGVLEKAAINSNSGGVKEIPFEQAQEGFRTLLEVWTNYFGKHPKLAPSRKN